MQEAQQQPKSTLDDYIDLWDLFADHVLEIAKVVQDLKIPDISIFMNESGNMNPSLAKIMLELKMNGLNAMHGRKINWRHNVLLLNHFIIYYQELNDDKLPIAEFDFTVAISTYLPVIMET